MRKILVGFIGGAALMQCGCTIIRDVETAKAEVEKDIKIAKTDISEAMEIWHKKFVPEFEVLKARLIKADEDITRDVTQAQKLWSSTVAPQIGATKEFFKDISQEVRTDVQKTEQFWDKDVEPRLKELEAILKKFEQDVAKVVHGVEREAKAVLSNWHKEFETHLSELERVEGAAAADFKQFEKKYDQMKAGLRTVATRVTDDVKHNAVVEHLENLVTHVQSLAEGHKNTTQPNAQGKLSDEVAKARKNVSAGIRKVMQLL